MKVKLKDTQFLHCILSLTFSTLISDERKQRQMSTVIMSSYVFIILLEGKRHCTFECGDDKNCTFFESACLHLEVSKIISDGVRS